MRQGTAGSAHRGPELVSVRSRRTVSACGTHLEVTVPCPDHEYDVPLEVCSRCVRCEGFHANPDDQTVEVVCSARESDEAPYEERLPLDPTRRRAATTPIAEIMTTQVVCLSQDLAMETLGPVLLSSDVSGVAVIDDQGRPVGVLSQSDVLSWLYAAQKRDESSAPETVGDIMTTKVLCLSESESIAKAAALMSFERVHRMPVVGLRGQLVGMLSPLDILRWFARQDGYVMSPHPPPCRAR